MPIHDHPRRLTFFLQAILTACLLLGSLLHLNTGLADSGDYFRVMTWFTSQPVGFSTNWPPVGSPEYQQRFFNFWLPYWKLDFPLQAPVISSTILLWLPGILANYLAYSTKILYLPFLSLLPRLLLLAYLLLAFYAFNKTRHALLFTVLIGLPYVCLATSTDYVAYLNSFYQETGTLVYLLGLIASAVLYETTGRRTGPLLLCILFTCLLVTAKVSNAYWAGLVALFLLVPLEKPFRTTALRLGLFIALVAPAVLFSFRFTAAQSMREQTAYASLFYGALPFSSDPAAILSRLDLADGARCVNLNTATAAGADCLEEFRSRSSYLNTLRSLYYDPPIFLRQLAFGAANMQVLGVQNLGNAPPNDPPENKAMRNNFWAALKSQFFPRGSGYWISITAMAFAFLGAFFFSPDLPLRWLAKLGLLLALASPLDLYVALFGDGKRDIIKHLFAANLTYDLAAILFVALLGLALSNRAAWKWLPWRGKENHAPSAQNLSLS